MKRYVNLGNFALSGLTSLTKFNLAKIPSVKNFHLGTVFFRLDISGTATGAVTTADFLRNLIAKFSLYLNNNIIVDNLNGQTLHWLYVRTGSQPTGKMIPSVAVADAYSVSYYFGVSLKNTMLLSPYDLCPCVSDVENMEFEIQLGTIDGLGASPTINCRVYAEIFERENEYYVPKMKIRQVSITKTVSDIVSIPNRTLFWAFFLPSTGTLEDTVVLRSKTHSILENQKLSDVQFAFLPPVVYDYIQDSDYSYIPFSVIPDGELSLKKPMLFENDQLFYDDLSASNSPFEFLTLEILPNENLGGESEIDSRYSPKKK